jgi:hypothetical protein
MLLGPLHASASFLRLCYMAKAHAIPNEFQLTRCPVPVSIALSAKSAYNSSQNSTEIEMPVY